MPVVPPLLVRLPEEGHSLECLDNGGKSGAGYLLCAFTLQL